MGIEKDSCCGYTLKKKKSKPWRGPRTRGVPVCFSLIGLFMKIKDVNLETIKTLLQGVPDDMEIESIDLHDNTYSLKLVANYRKIQENQEAETLKELMKIIKSLEG